MRYLAVKVSRRRNLQRKVLIRRPGSVYVSEYYLKRIRRSQANVLRCGESVWLRLCRTRLHVYVPENASCGGAKKIRLPGGDAKMEIRQDYLVATASCLLSSIHIPVETVHAVKGETHDFTIFVCPEPDKYNPCPSVVWWSDDPVYQEERRIAFVAVTRTRGDLAVCVSEQCLSRLQKNRASFVQSFEQMTVDDFVARKSACVTAEA